MAPHSSPPDPTGTEYANPAVRDGVNTPLNRPVRDAFFNLVIVAAGFAVLGGVLHIGVRYLAPFVPFRWERSLAGKDLLAGKLDENGEAKQRELRRIARAVSMAMELPDELELSVNYNPARTINAFATFGGNIIVFQGLLDVLESEDELTMVLAHEIAHVKHRDMLQGIMRVAGLLVFSSGLRDAGSLFDTATKWGMAGYGRARETAADREAVAVLCRIYGHAGGAEDFFTTLAVRVEKRDPGSLPALSGLGASHPDTLARLRACREEAARLGFSGTGEPAPLPAVFFR